MSIPLDRLYNHIDRLSQSLCGDCLIIYRFFPHGSKILKDLTPLIPFENNLKTWTKCTTSPNLLCYDQEPLDYDVYTHDIVKEFTEKKYVGVPHRDHLINIVSSMHLRAVLYFPVTCYDYVMLLHSEKNSKELEKYENNGFVGVYWWSHGIIARDWFRYAEHVELKKQVSKVFLIYNRAWAGTREYRLKFSELLITHALESHCQTTVNAVDPELQLHYNNYEFKNTCWKPNRVVEDHFNPTAASSNSSADFDLADYENTQIEVVLETLFDDSRWHLTEKTLRPIALGQPFILVSTPGSLQYLQSYGFKTFDSVWSESYDQIVDAKDRLAAVIQLMKTIANWDPTTQQNKINQARDIAEFNKKLFFSTAWQDQLLDEYEQNFKSAWEIMKQNRTGKHLSRLRTGDNIDPEWIKSLDSDLPWRTRADVEHVLEWLKNPS
jgi:hypothetical protein